MGLQLLSGLVTATGHLPDVCSSAARFHAQSGKGVVLSASCTVLCDPDAASRVTVLAPASLLWPFMDHQARSSISAALLPSQASPAHFIPPAGAAPAPITLQLPAARTLVKGDAGDTLLSLPCSLQGYLALPSAAAALDELLSDVRSAAGSQAEWQYAWGLASVPHPQAPARVPAHQRLAHAITSALSGPPQQALPQPSSISACMAVLTTTLSTSAQAAQVAAAARKQQLQLMRGAPQLGDGLPLLVGSSSRAPSGCGEEAAGELLLPGRKVLVMGSPFGCLAPHHFANSCMQGIVSMIPDLMPCCTIDGPGSATSTGWSPSHPRPAPVLFTVDAPCLPGMEGGLVHAGDAGPLGAAGVLGVLCLPLSRTSDGVQIQVAISWRHLLASLAHCSHQLPDQLMRQLASEAADTSAATAPLLGHGALPGLLDKELPSRYPAVAAVTAQPAHGAAALPAPRPPQLQSSPCSAPQRVAAAMRGVVLVRTQHSWATGVVISPGGLVLTNAHLLLPGVASGQQARAALRHAASQYAHAQRQPDTGALSRVDTHATHGSRACTDAFDALEDDVFALGPMDEVGHCSADSQQGPEAMAAKVCGDVEEWSEQAGSARGVARQLCRFNFRAGSGSPGSPGSLTRRPTGATCMVRMGLPGQQVRWCAAHALYIWTNHLDLAVLQVQLPDGCSCTPEQGLCHVQLAPLTWPKPAPAPLSGSAAASGRALLSSTAVPAAAGSRAVPLSRAAAGLLPAPGPVPGALAPAGVGYGSMPVYVVGHGLVGPAAGWPAAVTAGNVAQVVHVRGKPCMMITTATVHAGASGGAVLDQAGHLVALVTSNARHASGHTLPNLNFCIPAEELRPVVAALLRHEQRRGDAAAGHGHHHTQHHHHHHGCGAHPGSWGHHGSHGGGNWASSLDVLLDVHASRQVLREELDALDLRDPDADRVWNLEGPPPAPPWPAAAASATAPASPAGGTHAYAAACSPRSKL